MKTILLGFDDSGKTVLTVGTEADPNAQSIILTNAMTRNEFPAGVTRLEYGHFLPSRLAVKVNAQSPEKVSEPTIKTKSSQMNKILSLIALIGLVGLSASAKEPVYVPVALSYMPATLATTVETNLATPPIIDCGNQKSVAVAFSFNQASASTSNVVYVLDASVDGSVWDTNNQFTVTIPSQGATRVDIVTNITVNGIGYLRLRAIRNTTAITTMTNFGVKYGQKILAP